MTLLKAAFITGLFAILGYILKITIWRGDKRAEKPFEYGRKFASYAVMAASLSSVHFFTQNDYGVAAVSTVAVIFAFGFIAFALGLLYSVFNRSKDSFSSPRKSSSEQLDGFKLNSMKKNLVVLGSVSLAFFLAVLYFQDWDGFGSREKSKWIPVSNLYLPPYMNLDARGKFYYYDGSSIVRSGVLRYGYIGFDLPETGNDGRNFVKQKVEADCSIPKIRSIEQYAYTGNLEKGLGILVDEDRNLQATLAAKMLAVMKSYVHNGGWVSREEALTDIQVYSVPPYNDESQYGHMVANAKRNLAFINWLCS